jgi:hypothetical protein
VSVSVSVFVVAGLLLVLGGAILLVSAVGLRRRRDARIAARADVSRFREFGVGTPGVPVQTRRDSHRPARGRQTLQMQPARLPAAQESRTGPSTSR